MIISYDPNSGELGFSVNDPVPVGHAEYYRSEGISFVEVPEEKAKKLPGDFIVGYYYDLDAGRLKPKPILKTMTSPEILANDQDAYRIDGLPKPCTVSVDGVAYEVSDGVFEFTTPMAGTYAVAIDHFPYMPFSAEVVAR